jgi:Hemerythrin HHE cation binding domain
VNTDLQIETQHFHKEHQEILAFLDDWDCALNCVASDNIDHRLQGLEQLRAFETELIAIDGHCRAEERRIDSPYHLYMNDEQLKRHKAGHVELTHLIQRVIYELTYADTVRTEEVLSLGKQFSEFLRRHIAFEEGFLRNVESGDAAEQPCCTATAGHASGFEVT